MSGVNIQTIMVNQEAESPESKLTLYLSVSIPAIGRIEVSVILSAFQHPKKFKSSITSYN